MLLPVYLRAVWLFYRSLLLFNLPFSLLVFGAAAMFGNWPPQLTVATLVCKLVTFPVVWYLSGQMRPHQYWLYLNLHLRPWWLWAGVVMLDLTLCATLVKLLSLLLP